MSSNRKPASKEGRVRASNEPSKQRATMTSRLRRASKVSTSSEQQLEAQQQLGRTSQSKEKEQGETAL